MGAGRRLGDRYTLRRPLARGGMASVWLGVDERLGRPIAVKLLSDTLVADPEYLARFRREARVAAGLQHPHLVAIYDYGAGARPFLVMEYVEGGDLAHRLDAGENPDPERLAAELLSALRYIHAAGVLHRDIKPQNVLLDRNGHVRLTDFGIAQPREATSLTGIGEVIGTQSYLAPEVLEGEPASEASDLYALGMVLADVARAGAPPSFWALTDRMRSANPARRPASAAQALAELERSGSVSPGPPTRPMGLAEDEPHPGGQRPFEPTPTGTRRRPRSGALAALAAAGLAVVAAVVLALVAGGGGGGGDRPAREGPGDASGGGNGAGGGEPATTGSDGDAATANAGASAGDGSSGSEDVAGSDGAALNDQGYSLVNEGRYDEAVPVLERAVDALRGSGDEATYNYALYNLATAYMGSGRPADAIPLLEQRMGFDDGQLAKVQATLDEAYAAAGAKDGSGDESDGPVPGSGSDAKPGKGPKSGGLPPPFAAGD